MTAGFQAVSIRFKCALHATGSERGGHGLMSMDLPRLCSRNVLEAACAKRSRKDPTNGAKNDGELQGPYLLVHFKRVCLGSNDILRGNAGNLEPGYSTTFP